MPPKFLFLNPMGTLGSHNATVDLNHNLGSLTNIRSLRDFLVPSGPKSPLGDLGELECVQILTYAMPGSLFLRNSLKKLMIVYFKRYLLKKSIRIRLNFSPFCT